MAATVLVDLLPRITIPPTSIQPGEAALEALFEDEQGVRIPDATLTAEGYEKPTYFMSNRFPVMVTERAGTQSTGTAMLLNIPAP